jgi:hypothetical protein
LIVRGRGGRMADLALQPCDEKPVLPTGTRTKSQQAQEKGGGGAWMQMRRGVEFTRALAGFKNRRRLHHGDYFR